jgi:hypothetical protein
MAGICESSTRDSGGSCEHLTLTMRIDGGLLRTIKTGVYDPRWNDAIDDAEWDTCLKILARHAKSKGYDLASYVNRLFGLGEEATNLKQYDFIGPGGAITKTNIGTAYVDVLPGANGQRILVDCTGCTQFRPVLTANLVAAGPFQVRIVRDSDNTVLYESPSLTQTGERELDADWQTLPAWATGLEVLRLQAKSATGTDDPVFRRCVLLVR